MKCGVEFYRQAFEHEIVGNHAMLKMIASVPEEMRGERFQRAVTIAAHMAHCRQNFLDLFRKRSLELTEPFDSGAEFSSLEERFSSMEADWRDYFAALDDGAIDGMFTFEDNGEKWRISLEAQLFQLVGHAAYHRGQVVQIVDELGGETFNTDYIDWFTEHHPEGWGQGE